MDHVLHEARPDMIATASGSENMLDFILNLLSCTSLQQTNRHPNLVFMCKIDYVPIKCSSKV